jgi:hypothetical protein
MYEKTMCKLDTVELRIQIERLYLGLQQETLHSLLQQNHLQLAFSSSSSSNPKKLNPYHLQLQPNITKGGDNVRKSEKLDDETAS